MALSIGWLKGFLRNRLPMCNSALVLLFVITVTHLRIGAAWGHAAYNVVGRVTDPALTWGGLSTWIQFEDMHTAHVFATCRISGTSTEGL